MSKCWEGEPTQACGGSSHLLGRVSLILATSVRNLHKLMEHGGYTSLHNSRLGIGTFTAHFIILISPNVTKELNFMNWWLKRPRGWTFICLNPVKLLSVLSHEQIQLWKYNLHLNRYLVVKCALIDKGIFVYHVMVIEKLNQTRTLRCGLLWRLEGWSPAQWLDSFYFCFWYLAIHLWMHLGCKL